MNITDNLERLSKLHQDRFLSDEEFLQAKSQLLNQPAGTEPKPPTDSHGPAKKLDIQASKSYDAYSDGTKDLRTWLVAYGIGGPILFVSQKELADVLAKSPLKYCIVYFFLGGLALQIFMAFLNKCINFAAYTLSLNPPAKLSPYNRAVIWFANQFWMDTLTDILTIAAFIIATFYVLKIVLA